MPENQTRKAPQAGDRFVREVLIQRDAIDVDARTVSLAFSSESPVERYWGTEVLDHAPASVRLDRLRTTGPLLLNHDSDAQIGAVERVSIDADRVGRALVRFGRGQRAEEIFQDVRDGIRRSVSVGYQIHSVVLEKHTDDGDTYRVTDWEPMEISIVSVPADTRVGVGRALDSIPASPPSTYPEETHMQEQNRASESSAATASPAPVDVAGIEANVRAAEKQRVADLLAIGQMFAKQIGSDKLALAAIESGATPDEFRQKVLTALDRKAATELAPAAIGMTAHEQKRYSFMRAINYLANPRSNVARELAAFEIECSVAASEAVGKQARGLLVPHDVLTRDLTAGTNTAGGYTVATDLLSGSFIELLRNKLLLPGMGAQMLNGLVGNVAISRATGGSTGYWVAESGAPTESQAAFDQVTMSPKTVGAYSDLSRKLLLQSSIDIERFVQNDLATALALAIQQAAIKGGGSNEPTGILGTTGIGSVVGGTNGAAPTWANIIDLETQVSAANADVGTLGYLTNAKVRGKLKGTEKFTGTNGMPVWTDGAQPLNGYSAGVTNAVPSNGTKGSGTNLSAIIFGNFADLLIGLWGGLDINIDTSTGSTSGTVRIVTLQDVDVAVRHPESFAAMTDAITA